MRRSTRPHRAQQGSVYVITLVVLLVLTVLGLSAALITQSEMQIGVNERLAETMFYAAGSGIEVSTAKAVATDPNTTASRAAAKAISSTVNPRLTATPPRGSGPPAS